MAEEIVELLGECARLVRVDADGTRSCQREVPLPALLEWLATRALSTHGFQTPLLLPGTRYVRTLGPKTIIVVEQAPQVRRVRWINDGEDPSLPQDAFVVRRLAFPYLVFLLSFEDGELDGYHQLYYRTSPLDGLDAPLRQANLLNVTCGRDSPVSWLCLGQQPVSGLPWQGKVEHALRSFWETPFNLDFEVPRGSGFTRLRALDPRIASVGQWEAASSRDPLFPLSIDWPAAGLTLEEAVWESLTSTAPPTYPTTLAGVADALYRLPLE